MADCSMLASYLTTITWLSTGEGSHVIVVKYEASIEQSAIDAVKEVTDYKERLGY
jgi:hypothetical protein